jgi:ribose/xylose/arabinose/galactoside ABC-type transport system permease subunit
MLLHIGAAILIVLGVIFLLINLDIAPAAELKKLLEQWWPLLLIAVGGTVVMRPRRAR